MTPRSPNRLAYLAIALLVFVACGEADSSVSAPPGTDPAHGATSDVGADEALPPTTLLGGPADPGGTPAAVMPAGVGSWQLGRVAEGFQPVLLTDQGGRREIFYRRQSQLDDLYDAPILLTVTLEDLSYVDQFSGTSVVGVSGADAYLYELSGDGQRYGTAVTWRDDQDRWVTLAWGEIVPDEDVLALARSAEQISEGEWEHLRRILGSDAVIAGAPADTTEQIVTDGVSATGSAYRLVALTPLEYPLDANDRRRACYRFDTAGRTGPVLCDDHPWWVRTGGDTFVYGPVGLDVAEVTITRRGLDGAATNDEPIHTPTLHTGQPSPVGFYLAEIPDWCWVEIAPIGGTIDPRLGPIGPLPSDAHHAECLAE